MTVNADLITLGDIDELIRHLDRLCGASDWDGVVEVHGLARAAVERGRQLWPVAAHAEYRLALEAPASYAARTLVAEGGRFSLGPIAEVAASTHSWGELAPHAPPGPTASMAAHERIVRGEDLSGDDRVLPVLDLPLVLQPWEPAYPTAEYEAHEARFPAPSPSGHLEAVDLGEAKSAAADEEATRALLDLATAWTAESNGRAEVATVRGDAPAAIAALGLSRARMAAVGAADALALMAWTAASGGAHGRRRGMASGRFAGWWAVGALAGASEDWPLPADEVGELAGELNWFVWDPGGPDTGWACRLAVEDPADGLAWALSATDARYL